MSDSTKKVLVVVIGLLVISVVVLVRTGLVLGELVEERAEAYGRAEAACEAKVERTTEGASPLPGFQSALAYRRTTAPPSAIRLATLKLPGMVSAHRRVVDSDHLQYVCLYKAAVEMGGNAVVIEGIEPDPGDSTRGRLVEGVFLVTASPPPEPYGARFPAHASVVTDLVGGGPAERAGLRPGDVLVDVDHRGLGEGGGREWTAVDEAVNRVPDGGWATLTIIRAGQPMDLSLRKEGGRFGYQYLKAPVRRAGS